MEHELNRKRISSTTTLPLVELPPDEPPPPEEIARRTAVIQRIQRLREENGPIGIATDELVHLARTLDEK